MGMKAFKYRLYPNMETIDKLQWVLDRCRELYNAALAKQDEQGTYLPNGARAKAGLNKSILDAGWHQFITFCTYKAACAGTVQVVKVDPKYTSQICSGCGVARKKELSERWHSCPCGMELNRDHNAAINILVLGKKQQARTEPTWVTA